MAGEPPEEAHDEDIPQAGVAFELQGPERDALPAVVARAAALLALVRPPAASDVAFRAATREARELLNVEPVTAPVEPAPMEGRLESIGSAGIRAAALLRDLRKRRPTAEGEGEGEGIVGRRITEGMPGPSFWGMRRRVSLSSLRARALEREDVDAAQRSAAQDVFAAPGSVGDRQRVEAAGQLIAASLLDPHPLVQVTAAGAALRFEQRNPLANAMLDDASRDDGPGVRGELSRAILGADRQSETRRIELEHSDGEGDPEPDAVVVHGTWARRGRWWTPGGDLHRFLAGDPALFPRLYRGRDPFRWSGYFDVRTWRSANSDWNRQQAADSLAWWAQRKLISQPDIIGHSYGGSVAMMATRAEKQLRGLVLLSPAVHHPCLPDQAYYDRILHVSARLDLVLLADLSRASLLDSCPRVDPWLVPRTGWTGHRSTRDPLVWESSGLADHVRDTWLPSLAPKR